MDCEEEAMALRSEYADTVSQVQKLLDQLDTVQILRSHMPPSKQGTVDRLDTALRLLGRIEDELEVLEVMTMIEGKER
jgi:hypothetical protein